MGDNAGKFQFVSVGSAGQPKNASDRKTIRKAAMQAFRRRERIERIKAFAAECATEAQTGAKAAAPLAARPKGPSTAAAKTGGFSPPRAMVILKKSGAHTQYGTSPEEETTPGGEVLPWSTDRNPPIYKQTPPEIPLDLGYLNDFSCGDMPSAGYLFDYCTHTLLKSSPTIFYIMATKLLKIRPKSFLS